MRQMVICLLLLVPLAACTPNPQHGYRTLEATLPASGITTLVTHANTGAINITPSNDEQIHVSVKLHPSSSFLWQMLSHSKASEAIHVATIQHALEQGALDLGLRYPPNVSADDIDEDWDISIPARMQVKNQFNIGKLQVTGIAGGVEAQMNIGKVELDVPGGALDVSVNIGKIEAEVHSGNYGNVTIATNIGDTTLKVNGLKIGDSQQQGTGSQMNYQGKGSNPISLKVNTGKVSLALSDQDQTAVQHK